MLTSSLVTLDVEIDIIRDQLRSPRTTDMSHILLHTVAFAPASLAEDYVAKNQSFTFRSTTKVRGELHGIHWSRKLDILSKVD